MRILAILTTSLLIIFVLAMSYLSVSKLLHEKKHNEFRKVPTAQIHIMQVWEDGSFIIEYKDGTSEIGCLKNGLCQD